MNAFVASLWYAGGIMWFATGNIPLCCLYISVGSLWFVVLR